MVWGFFTLTALETAAIGVDRRAELGLLRRSLWRWVLRGSKRDMMGDLVAVGLGVKLKDEGWMILVA